MNVVEIKEKQQEAMSGNMLKQMMIGGMKDANKQ